MPLRATARCQTANLVGANRGRIGTNKRMSIIRKEIKRHISACPFDSFLAIDRAKIDAVRLEFDTEIATTTTRFPIECAPLRQRIFLGQIGRVVVVGTAAIGYDANGRETELTFFV